MRQLRENAPALQERAELLRGVALATLILIDDHRIEEAFARLEPPLPRETSVLEFQRGISRRDSAQSTSSRPQERARLS
jgi:hypothetical protein